MSVLLHLSRPFIETCTKLYSLRIQATGGTHLIILFNHKALESSTKLYKALKCRAKKAYGNDVYTMRDVELLRMSWFVTHSKSFIEMIPKIL